MNSLNMPIRRQRSSKWIKNQTQLYVVYQKTTLNIDTDRLKIKG